MFDFTKDYRLENNRVQLIPLNVNDYENLIHFSLQEPELWTYSFLQANSKEKLKSYIDLALKGRAAEKEYPFIVFDKQKNMYAGSTRFYDIQIEQATLQLGYTWYGKDFQGTGLNKNCKYLLLEFAFESMNMERVEFRADYENKRSIAAMNSIGCTEEGILRSHGYRSDGTRRDSIVLSILRSEWYDHVKDHLTKLIHV